MYNRPGELKDQRQLWANDYLENPPKPTKNEFAKYCSKSNTILKCCVLCDYKEKEKKLGATSNLTQFYFEVEVK